MSKLRLVVTGLAATYPFGGVFWDYMQYFLGLHRLGHDVWYIEDTGKWCYDPRACTFVEDGSANAQYLARQLTLLAPELRERWFYRDPTGQTFGRTWAEVKEFCRSADLFLHISASCWMREEYFAAERVAFIDSDPMYTQASILPYLDGSISAEARTRVDMLRAHDVFFTFAENIGAPDCLIPTELFHWLPTRQPVVLDCFTPAMRPLRDRRRVLTTVASWEPTESGPVIRGVTYRGKSTEFERFLDLPARSPLPLELALSGTIPGTRLQEHGWQVRDAYEISHDPWIYRDYLAHSLAEWSVAKNAYVASRSGWFSCRTACYLALGVPAIVQDTGFSTFMPSSAGLLAFTTLEEASEAIASLLSAPEHHARAAHTLAREYFDARLVLSRLLEQALAEQPASVTRSSPCVSIL
ncbi:MAG: glycosyltransferase family 1 protein [Candidatus Tectimicrobiota bacterium]